MLFESIEKKGTFLMFSHVFLVAAGFSGSSVRKISIHMFSKTFLLRSGEVEAVKVHYLVPRHYEVVQ